MRFDGYLGTKDATNTRLERSGALGLSLAFGGFAACAEYVSKVLPLQALSELPADGQLSLSVMLHWLGVSDRAALAVGTISYIAVSAVTVAVAGSAASRLKSDAVLAALPAAGAVLGGTYVHGTDIVAAIPLALIMAVQMHGNKVPVALGLTLVVVFWGAALEPTTGLVSWFALCSVCAGYVLHTFTRNNVFAVASTIIIFGVLSVASRSYGAASYTYMQRRHPSGPALDDRYPEASWANAIRDRYSTDAPMVWPIRILTWGGLTFLVGMAVRAGILELRTGSLARTDTSKRR